MIWIIGAGSMAREYVKVLQALELPCRVIGRSEARARQLADDTGVDVVAGGLAPFLQSAPDVAGHAIVCTPVDQLATVSRMLMQYGVKSLLVEKPAAIDNGELQQLIDTADESGAKVKVGYNRRFYQSVIAMEGLIEADGGLSGCHFEVTEWGHRVVDAPSSAPVKQKWLLANTTHVIDLAFFETGLPAELSSFTSGSLDWHRSAARFCGAGIADGGALLSYMGYWDGPGRWALEFVTRRNRYILSPLERLKVQKIGEIAVAEVPGVDYSLDDNFKPGLYLQTRDFVTGAGERLCDLHHLQKAFPFYLQIAAYDPA